MRFIIVSVDVLVFLDLDEHAVETVGEQRGVVWNGVSLVSACVEDLVAVHDLVLLFAEKLLTCICVVRPVHRSHSLIELLSLGTLLIGSVLGKICDGLNVLKSPAEVLADREPRTGDTDNGLILEDHERSLHPRTDDTVRKIDYVGLVRVLNELIAEGVAHIVNIDGAGYRTFTCAVRPDSFEDLLPYLLHAGRKLEFLGSAFVVCHLYTSHTWKFAGI